MFQTNRCPVSVVLLAVIIACWAWIVPMSLDMYGGMSGSSAWMMTDKWDAVHLLLLCAMWVVMMIGMMLPSAAPAVLDLPIFGRLDAKRKYKPRKGFVFMAGYVAIWVGVSLLAFLIQRILNSSQILSPMMEIRSTRLSITLLAVASAYQYTPLKRACLRSCRCLTATESKSGFRGGIENGLGCLGSCWALMLLLFVGGVMNLWWISGLTLFVLAEKLSSPGWQRACLIALPSAASGLWIASKLAG